MANESNDDKMKTKVTFLLHMSKMQSSSLILQLNSYALIKLIDKGDNEKMQTYGDTILTLEKFFKELINNIHITNIVKHNVRKILENSVAHCSFNNIDLKWIEAPLSIFGFAGVNALYINVRKYTQIFDQIYQITKDQKVIFI